MIYRAFKPILGPAKLSFSAAAPPMNIEKVAMAALEITRSSGSNAAQTQYANPALTIPAIPETMLKCLMLSFTRYIPYMRRTRKETVKNSINTVTHFKSMYSTRIVLKKGNSRS